MNTISHVSLCFLFSLPVRAVVGSLETVLLNENASANRKNEKIRSQVNSYIFQMVVHFARHVMGSIVFHREVLLVIFASWWILLWILKRLSSVCSLLYAAVEREWHSPLDSR